MHGLVWLIGGGCVYAASYRAYFARNWWHVGVAVGAFLAGIALLVCASAAPPPGSDGHLHDFYASLKQPGTDISCCSEADCRPVDYRIEGDHYVATRADGSTVQIDPSVIIHRNSNPVGRAILCEGSASHVQFCFLPWGSGT